MQEVSVSGQLRSRALIVSSASREAAVKARGEIEMWFGRPRPPSRIGRMACNHSFDLVGL